MNETEKLHISIKNKIIPTKYLYDDKGSKLFEDICNTEEYYLTRTEKSIVQKYAKDIMAASSAEEFFELGSGSSKKTKILILEALKYRKKLTYTSFDISKKALEMSKKELKTISKNLSIQLVKGDFINDLKNIDVGKDRRLYLFLGSTLGNFNNQMAISFLYNLSKIMKKKDFLLIGIDKIKDHDVIKSAYDDKAGYTEKFNKNILDVINNKYNLDFEKNNFTHSITFNKSNNQIEMYLTSKTKQVINFPNKEKILIEQGDKLLTEISRKFNDKTIKKIFSNSSLKIRKTYFDDNKYFSLYLLNSKL